MQRSLFLFKSSIIVFGAFLFLSFPAHHASASSVVASQTEQNNIYYFSTSDISNVSAQPIIFDKNTFIDNVSFWIQKWYSSPTGNIHLQIRTASRVNTGTLIATSVNTSDVSTLPTEAQSAVKTTFNFSNIILIGGVKYYFVAEPTTTGEVVAQFQYTGTGTFIPSTGYTVLNIDDVMPATPIQKAKFEIVGVPEVVEVPLYTQIQSNFPDFDLTGIWAAQKYGTGNYPNCVDSLLGYATIARCGCTITSIVMVMRYYGIENNVMGSEINPGTLNTWLTGNGGYDPSGTLSSWGQISNYAKDSTGPKKVVFINRVNLDTDPTHTVTESELKSLADVQLNKQVLNPVILFEDVSPTHFIVASAKDGARYKIRDPHWYNTTYLDGHTTSNCNTGACTKDYQNTFHGVRIFDRIENVFSQEQIELTLASPAELLITDPDGKKLGKDPANNLTFNQISGASYTEEGISDPTLDNPTPTSHRSKHISIPAPLVGNYTVQVIGTGSGTYTLTSTVSDTEGDLHREVSKGNTIVNLQTAYNLSFSETDPGTIDIIPQDTTPPIISNTSLAPEYILNSSAVQFNYSAQDVGEGLFSVSATLDGQPLTSGQPIDFNSPGTHAIVITAKDFINNTATE